jgi:pimeloyl-ACP methyl ester carboxylesterase
VAELHPDNPWLAARWAQRDHIAKIPTLILWGSRDPIFPNHFLQRWRTLFQQSRIATFHDAGHLIQEEASREYVKEIEQFLAS